jgi:hypothetical protein
MGISTPSTREKKRITHASSVLNAMDYSIIVSDVVPVEVTIISNIFVVTNHLAATQILPETTNEATTEATMEATTDAATETTMEAATEAVMDYSTF